LGSFMCVIKLHITKGPMPNEQVTKRRSTKCRDETNERAKL